MIIDSINIASAPEGSFAGSEYIQLSLSPGINDSYILEAATGFDVDEVVSQLYGGTFNNDFNNLTIPDRDITLKIRLNPNYETGETPSTLRNNLYKVIAPTRSGLAQIKLMLNGSMVASIDGFITKFEASIFSPEPEIAITLSCTYPWFRGPEQQLAGSVSVPNPILVDNLSNAPHGFVMRLNFIGTVSTSFTIQGKYGTTDWPFRLLRPSGNPFVSGDQLYISSNRDNRYVYMVRSGITTHLADTIDYEQAWPLMFPGFNQLGFSSSLVTIVSLIYRPHYWGV